MFLIVRIHILFEHVFNMSINQGLIQVFVVDNIIFIDYDAKLMILLQEPMQKILPEGSTYIERVYQKEKECIKSFMPVEHFFKNYLFIDFLYSFLVELCGIILLWKSVMIFKTVASVAVYLFS